MPNLHTLLSQVLVATFFTVTLGAWILDLDPEMALGSVAVFGSTMMLLVAISQTRSEIKEARKKKEMEGFSDEQKED